MTTTDVSMRYRTLGSFGPEVSAVGLGCNNFGSRLGRQQSTEVVHAALDAGITLFDTADIYGGFGPDSGESGDSERHLGAALRGRRDRAIIATKFGMHMPGMPTSPGGSPDYVRTAVEGSLRRLGTDYIDVYQYHEQDGVTPLEETMAVLRELVDEGKVRYVGLPTMPSQDLRRAHTAASSSIVDPFLVSVQARYHLLDRTVERELAPTCVELGVGILPFYPLANGLLTGKYRRGVSAQPGTRLSWREGWLTAASLDRVERLAAFGSEHGRTLLEVAIGGLGAQPGVASVIAGAMSAEQVLANAAAGSWEPTAAELDRLANIVARGERVV